MTCEVVGVLCALLGIVIGFLASCWLIHWGLNSEIKEYGYFRWQGKHYVPEANPLAQEKGAK